MDLNILATSKKNYIEIMPTSIPHQKLSFYHLPTRGRAGIKLGDADTSPSYLQFFIVPCQYSTTFIYFWQLFILFFGTNILIQCPVPVPVCCMFFVSQKIHIKRSPNGIKTDGEYFWNIWRIWEEKSTRYSSRGGHEVGGCAPGCQERP